MAVRKRGEGVPATPNVYTHSNGPTTTNVKGDAATQAKTDLTRWRMKDVNGVHTWHYLQTDEEVKAWPMSVAEKWYLWMDTVGSELMRMFVVLTCCYIVGATRSPTSENNIRSL
jgi:lanosterol synthase